MPNFVALTVAKGDKATGTISVAFPANGAGGLIIETINNPITVGGIVAVSQIIAPATGLNQKAVIYYSATTVALLVVAMG